MNMLEKTRRWCQESPNNPISTKLRRNAPPIIVLFTATILALSFFSYMSYVANHPNIQIIQQPDVQPKPNNSPTTESNKSQTQPVTPASQQPLPPDYPSTTPQEIQLPSIDSRVVMNEQGEPVLQIIEQGHVIAEYNQATGVIIGTSIGSIAYVVRFANGTIIHVPVNSP